MTDQHPADDLLVALALDALEQDRRAGLSHHLAGCDECRSRYDAIASTVERTLPATPRVEPPAGFEAAVLASLGSTDDAGDIQPSRHARRWRRIPQLVAAAVLGTALGVGATVLGIELRESTDGAPASAMTANSAPLRTGDGEPVGTAATSALEDDPVVVITVAQPVVDVEYRCELVLADGRRVDTGTWTARTEHGWTWVVPAPDDGTAEVVGLELVTNEGTVWSSTEFAG